ncbi:MAG: hypothetical protein K6T78_16180 [Alicyclobacillus sp.]|nr:hypothetical protein [Alicyclobacillus sp.]
MDRNNRRRFSRLADAVGDAARFAQRHVLTAVLCIVFAVVISTLLLLLWLPTTHRMLEIDHHLNPISDIVAYLSTLYTALAFIVALIAYRAAVRKPKLRVRFLPESGRLDHPVLVITPSRRVDITRPSANWKVLLENSGSASARYAVVQIEFDGLYFTDQDFPGWEKVLEADALGWYGIRWSAGVNRIVHPNFPIEISPLSFGGLSVHAAEVRMAVTVAADGFRPLRKTHTVTLLPTGNEDGARLDAEHAPLPGADR